jgi:nucleoside-diphosphate-sugar epimerase
MLENNQLHVVLGATGAIGQYVIAELKERNLPIRVVGRNKTFEELDFGKADALNLEELKKSVQGATHLYCLLGLEYTTEVWQRDWPIIIQNLASVCVEQNIKLVFFDNIYMYGPTPLQNPITEDHQRQPVSKKGQVRHQLEKILVEAGQNQGLKYIIARAPDFYGPSAKLSLLYASVLDRMLTNKAPQILVELDYQHSFIFTRDAGRACVWLALEESAYNQVWHLPTSDEKITPRQLINKLQAQIGTNYELKAMPSWFITVLGWFIPIIKELQEMLYQYNSDYVFSSQKFMTKFPDFQVTQYDDGAKQMVDYFRATKVD